jgi:hypothetical protein
MTSVQILIVEKSGIIKEKIIQYVNEEDLYKKAGFKTPNDFKLQAQWNIENVIGKAYNISVFGKTKGLANQENKYEFPPPIDNTLFFGSCVILNIHNGTPKNLERIEWDNIYNHLYGGFEDIGAEDSNDEEEDEETDLPTTKYGYVKDGFVVDDEDEVELEDESAESEEEDSVDDEDEDELFTKKKKPVKSKGGLAAAASRKNKTANTKTAKTSTKNPPTKSSTDDLQVFECTNELTEEEYV